MSKQPEALRLAESAHLGYRVGWQRNAAVELRRLHEQNAQLLKALQYAVNHCAWPARYGTQNEHQLEALDLIEKADGMQ